MMSSKDKTFDTNKKSCFKVKPLPFCTRNKLMDLAIRHTWRPALNS